MTVTFSCPHCKQRYATSGHSIGQRIRCRHCDTVFLAEADAVSRPGHGVIDTAFSPDLQVDKSPTTIDETIDDSCPPENWHDAFSDTVEISQRATETVEITFAQTMPADRPPTELPPKFGRLSSSCKSLTSPEGHRYAVEGTLGRGASAQVYRVLDRNLERKVAVKVLRREQENDSAQAHFLREARISAKLEHPNILPIYDLDSTETGQTYIAMRLAEGISLGDVLRESAKTGRPARQISNLQDKLNIFLRICDAIAFAHSHGVIHQDIKPDNVMLGQYGEVVLVDWGTARMEKESAGGKTGIVGTPAYMSPEQTRGEASDQRSDVYCLGATLFHMLTLRYPTWSDDLDAFWEMKRKGEITPLTDEELAANPPALFKIALKAMDKNPSKRYQSAKELQTAVIGFQDHLASLQQYDRACQTLGRAAESQNYELFNTAIFGFKEALDLWPENTDAAAALIAARLDYARAALARGDLDLARSQCVADDQNHESLLKEIDAALAERNRRQFRLRLATRTAIALGLTMILVLSVASVWIQAARHAAERELAEKVQLQKEKEAAIAKREAEAQESLAEGAALLDKAEAVTSADEKEKSLIAAQGAFRRAIFLAPDNPACREGFRNAALRHCEFAASMENWRQAESLLEQAKDAGLSQKEFDERLAGLGVSRNARDSALRNRIDFLMQDAASPDRTILHQEACQELISLKGPVTISRLTDYLIPEKRPATHEGQMVQNQVQLAIDALAWLGDPNAVLSILPYIEPEAFNTSVAAIVQEAAIIAVCRLLEPEDQASLAKLQQRLQYTDGVYSGLGSRVRPHFDAAVKRVKLDAEKPLGELTYAELDRLAFLLERAGHYDEALRMCEAILKLTLTKDREVYTHGRMATINQKAGNIDAALKCVNRLLEVDPKNPFGHAAKSRLLRVQGHLIEAHAAAENSLQYSRDFPEGIVSLLLVQERLHDDDSILALTRRLLGNKEKDWAADVRIMTMHAAALVRRWNYEESLGALDNLLAKNNQYALALVQRGNILMSMGRYRESVLDFDRAISLEPGLEDAYQSKAEAHVQMFELESALSDYRQLALLAPDDAKTTASIGALLRAAGQIEEAKKVLEETFKAHPADNEALTTYVNELGTRLEVLRRGESLTDKTLRTAEDLLYRIEYLLAKEKTREASIDLQEAVRLSPHIEDGRCYELLAKISITAGDSKASLKHLKAWIGIPGAPLRARETAIRQMLAYDGEEKEHCLEDALRVARETVTHLENQPDANPSDQASFQALLAQTLFQMKKKNEAVAAQKKALALLPTDAPSDTRQSYQYFLDKYQKN